MNRTSEQDVAILVNGKPVRTVAHNGNLYVIAKEGAKYEIRLSNHSTSRVLGVCSVDGLNVIDGTSADLNGAGYIIHGYGSYLIKGFRTSNDEVRPFVFSKKAKSYAAKSEEGDVKNCGVIGFAFHAEKRPKETVKVIREKEYIPYPVDRPYPVYPRPYDYPWYPKWPWRLDPYWCGGGQTWTSDGGNINATFTCSAGNTQSAASNQSQQRSINQCNLSNAASTSFDMGTQFSDQSVNDSVVTSTFEKDHVACQFEIFYASEKVLRKMGVSLDKASAVAFPASFPQGFCKPPKK